MCCVFPDESCERTSFSEQQSINNFVRPRVQKFCFSDLLLAVLSFLDMPHQYSSAVTISWSLCNFTWTWNVASANIELASRTLPVWDLIIGRCCHRLWCKGNNLKLQLSRDLGSQVVLEPSHQIRELG